MAKYTETVLVSERERERQKVTEREVLLDRKRMRLVYFCPSIASIYCYCRLPRIII